MQNRKPEPTRRQKERVLKSTQYRVKLDLVLSYDYAVPIATGRQDARRLLDAIDLGGLAFEADPALGEAFLKCAELKRILRVHPAEEGDSGQD